MPRALVLSLALALALRVVAVARTWNAQPWGDPADYHLHGATLALVGTYPPTTLAEPGGASAPALVGGVVLVRRGRLGPVWLWLVPVVLIADVAPLTGSPRYRASIDPFLLMLAAAVVVQLIDRRHASRGGTATTDGPQAATGR